jgi:hypothetical protein
MLWRTSLAPSIEAAFARLGAQDTIPLASGPAAFSVKRDLVADEMVPFTYGGNTTTISSSLKKDIRMACGNSVDNRAITNDDSSQTSQTGRSESWIKELMDHGKANSQADDEE